MAASGILIAIFAPLVGMVLLALLGERLKTNVRWFALPFPILSFALIVLETMGHSAGTQNFVHVGSWIPGLGLDFLILIDGLSLFFGLVVSGVGVLIFFYASQYMDDHYKHHDRFYAYLLLFMAAMLGTVFSGNLLLMFAWWELTGIASFFLIGFLHHTAESRSGARMAFLITVSTGLVMLAGIMLVSEVTGTFNLNEILSQPIDSSNSLWIAAFVLIAIGGFGKSAQFPFYFWLPNAMAAPTPVSAYLHSATMVKLGVFLTARIYPMFSEVDLWTPLLTSIGLLTFMIASVFALISHKLKAILAYSTVAALAFLIAFYGMAPTAGMQWDLMHIQNHVFYKGCLFMVVGIVTHCTGMKDIRELGGLRKRMPLLATITAISAASMAGVILTFGFLSKDYALAEKIDYMTEYGSFMPAMPLALYVLGSIFKVAFSLRLFWHIFMGAEPKAVGEHFHAPSFGVQLPPLILAVATVFFGFFPSLLQGFYEKLAVPGLHAEFKPSSLYLWHGFDNIAFQMSAGILAVGVLLYIVLDRFTGWRWEGIPKAIRLDDAFEWGIARIPKFGNFVNQAIRADTPTAYIPIIASAFIVTFGAYVAYHPGIVAIIADKWSFPFHEAEVIALMTATLIAVAAQGILIASRWTTQLIFTSIVGFLITFYFVLFRAPDLAMTQILIEAATLIMILLLLARFPRRAQAGEESGKAQAVRKTVNSVIAIGFGVIVGSLTLIFGLTPSSPIGPWYIENTLEKAYGTNAVNTILVDFRALDTLLEVGVLLIAGLGILALLMRRKRTPAEMKEGPHGQGGLGIDPKPKR